VTFITSSLGVGWGTSVVLNPSPEAVEPVTRTKEAIVKINMMLGWSGAVTITLRSNINNGH
jgi:hypothetical protein